MRARFFAQASIAVPRAAFPGRGATQQPLGQRQKLSSAVSPPSSPHKAARLRCVCRRAQRRLRRRNCPRHHTYRSICPAMQHRRTSSGARLINQRPWRQAHAQRHSSRYQQPRQRCRRCPRPRNYRTASTAAQHRRSGYLVVVAVSEHSGCTLNLRDGSPAIPALEVPALALNHRVGWRTNPRSRQRAGSDFFASPAAPPPSLP